MTVTQVFDEIEATLESLKLKDRLGFSIPGDQAYGLLEIASSGGWGELLKKLQAAEISLHDFRAAAMDIVEQIRRVRFWKDFEIQLTVLRQKQTELNLLSEDSA